MNNIISTKVSVFRNLKNYKFLQKLSSKDKEEIVDKLLSVFNKEFCLKNKSNYAPQNARLSRVLSGCSNNVMIDENRQIVIDLFNEEIICITSEDVDVSKAYTSVKTIADELANKIELAYNDDYGYLMSDISKLGSGYAFEARISMPALEEMGKVDQLKSNLKKLGYRLTETNFSSVYSLKSGCNLGYTERQVFEDFQKMVQKIDSLEIESAKMLDLTKHDEIIDRTRRSLAILKSAYILNQEELVSHLNNLRMGVDLGVCDISLERINAIQDLIDNAEFISDVQSKELASKVNNLLKGE